MHRRAPVAEEASISNRSNKRSKMATTEAAPPMNKTWELSAYERQRAPQELITDGTEIAVSPRKLHSELMCPICLDMLKNTMTTKECLHRFCQECITTALRNSNKECPTCRKKLVSRRSLRADPNFDALIEKIYPSRDEYEAHQERVLAKLNKHHSHAALMQSIEHGMRQQAMFRVQRTRFKRQLESTPTAPAAAAGGSGSGGCSADEQPAASTMSNQQLQQPYTPPPPQPPPPKRSRTNSTDSSANASSSAAGEADESSGANPVDAADAAGSSEIELVFKALPGEVAAAAAAAGFSKRTRYIKTTANASVDHLAKYLAMQTQADGERGEGSGSSAGGGEREGSGGASVSGGNAGAEKTVFQISILTSTGYFVLPGEMTLESVNSKYWKMNKPLELYFGLAAK